MHFSCPSDEVATVKAFTLTEELNCRVRYVFGNVNFNFDIKTVQTPLPTNSQFKKKCQKSDLHTCALPLFLSERLMLLWRRGSRLFTFCKTL